MAKFREVLKNRIFFLLWLGQIISQLGDRLDQMALIAFVYLRAPGSPLQIANILSFTIIPVFLIGPLAGVYVDRGGPGGTFLIGGIKSKPPGPPGPKKNRPGAAKKKGDKG